MSECPYTNPCECRLRMWVGRCPYYREPVPTLENVMGGLEVVTTEQLTALQSRVAELEAENKLLDLRVKYLVASINNSRSICHWSEPKFPHECVAIQDGHSASCRICEKDMGWFCAASPTKCCEYSDESEYDECCIHCKLPSERK